MRCLVVEQRYWATTATFHCKLLAHLQGERRLLAKVIDNLWCVMDLDWENTVAIWSNREFANRLKHLLGLNALLSRILVDGVRCWTLLFDDFLFYHAKVFIHIIIIFIFVIFFFFLVHDLSYWASFGEVQFDEMARIHLYVFITDFNNLVVCHGVVSLWHFYIVCCRIVTDRALSLWGVVATLVARFYLLLSSFSVQTFVCFSCLIVLLACVRILIQNAKMFWRQTVWCLTYFIEALFTLTRW